MTTSRVKLGRLSSRKLNRLPSDSTFFTDSADIPPRLVSLRLEMTGHPPESQNFAIIVVFSGMMILDGAWHNKGELALDSMHLNLNDKVYQKMIMSHPIMFLVRAIQTKSVKEVDPLLHPENRAGAALDLLPLLLGQEEILVNLNLLTLVTGEFYGTCQIKVQVTSPGITENCGVPLILTMKSAHCMPPIKDFVIVYICAIGLTDIHDPKAVYFGMSLSSPDSKYSLWASCSNALHAANAVYNVINDDKFVPEDLNPKGDQCESFHWNAINRVLVNPEELFERLSKPFMIDVSAVPRAGKLDSKGRYMGWVDARALLEPGQTHTTVAVKLYVFDETRTLNTGTLLALPPASAKANPLRESDFVFDDMGHNSYVVISLDLMEPLIPKTKILSLYDTIGFLPPENFTAPINVLQTYIKTEEPEVDAKYIRKSASALAVHKELCELAWRGSVPMTQSIKRSAANQLLVGVRTILKNFPPGDCSYLDWQDTITGQHAAGRRAVTASFEPQPPPDCLPDKKAISRCRVAEDNRIAQKHIKTNLKVAGRHPRSLICKALRCLEQRNDLDAKNYLFEALSCQPNNIFLLWLLGAQEYDKGTEAEIIASAAFQITVNGEYSDGTSNGIAWAALHTFYHATDNQQAAYIAARMMRKSFSLPVEWTRFLKCWIDTSGEEEVVWDPLFIVSNNPLLIAAAFFLCLRCFKFCESILRCLENECDKRGVDNLESKPTVEKYYLWAALFILRNLPDRALEVTKLGIKEFGPSALMSQMYLSCLSNFQDWDSLCESAFQEAERAGAKMTAAVLYKSALARLKKYPYSSLQRAARAHEISPSAFTSLLLGRIYAVLGKESLAQRWCVVAVQIEPLLADGWAMLCLLAIYEKDLHKARALLRTARQVGPICTDIAEQLDKFVSIVQMDQLPDALVKNIFMQRD